MAQCGSSRAASATSPTTPSQLQTVARWLQPISSERTAFVKISPSRRLDRLKGHVQPSRVYFRLSDFSVFSSFNPDDGASARTDTPMAAVADLSRFRDRS